MIENGYSSPPVDTAKALPSETPAAAEEVRSGPELEVDKMTAAAANMFELVVAVLSPDRYNREVFLAYRDAGSLLCTPCTRPRSSADDGPGAFSGA